MSVIAEQTEIKRKAGRPKVDIDWGFVDAMLEADCTSESIAQALGISVDTFYVRCKTDKNQDFSAYSQQKRKSGENLLRHKQYEVAMQGDKVMLVWLGKNRLGQADKQEIAHSNDTLAALNAYNLWLEKNPGASLNDKLDAIKAFAAGTGVDEATLKRETGIETLHTLQ